MGWGSGLASEAALPPMADRDCGCWKLEKPDVVVIQELSDRLSEAVKAEPERRGQDGRRGKNGGGGSKRIKDWVRLLIPTDGKNIQN